VFARFVTGVRVHVETDKVVIETDVQGSSARLEAVAGPAATALGLVVTPPSSTCNVADVTHVKATELAALFVSSNFTATSTADGNLRVASASGGDFGSFSLQSIGC